MERGEVDGEEREGRGGAGYERVGVGVAAQQPDSFSRDESATRIEQHQGGERACGVSGVVSGGEGVDGAVGGGAGGGMMGGLNAACG